MDVLEILEKWVRGDLHAGEVIEVRGFLRASDLCWLMPSEDDGPARNSGRRILVAGDVLVLLSGIPPYVGGVANWAGDARVVGTLAPSDSSVGEPMITSIQSLSVWIDGIRFDSSLGQPSRGCIIMIDDDGKPHRVA